MLLLFNNNRQPGPTVFKRAVKQSQGPIPRGSFSFLQFFVDKAARRWELDTQTNRHTDTSARPRVCACSSLDSVSRPPWLLVRPPALLCAGVGKINGLWQACQGRARVYSPNGRRLISECGDTHGNPMNGGTSISPFKVQVLRLWVSSSNTRSL